VSETFAPGRGEPLVRVDASPWISSSVPKGGFVHRHEFVLDRAFEPVEAACALRGPERVMLACGDAAAGGSALLYVGELAVCADADDAAAPDGAGDPLGAAVDFLATLGFEGTADPKEHSWVGFLGYDAVRGFERLPDRPDPIGPCYELFLPRVLVRLEPERTVVVGRGPTAQQAAFAAAEARDTLLVGGPEPDPARRVGEPVFSLGYEAYEERVRRAKQYIVDGDVFQLVLSLSCRAEAEFDGLAVYRDLAAINPSPYQYWFRGPRFEALGCSPEPCLLLSDGRALIRPLAGTRPRGADAAADARAEREMRASEKERAEHRMLVDLARNDLGRVCVPGSVRVPRLMDVERYSHVMHLTSDVVGVIAPGKRVDDLIRATFPAGTMTGAPKIRSMEIIDELEPAARGLYSGAVGSFGLDCVDLFLTIRGLTLRDGRVAVQAGGGIVYDSDPLEEYRECLAKLSATARAAGLDLTGGAR